MGEGSFSPGPPWGFEVQGARPRGRPPRRAQPLAGRFASALSRAVRTSRADDVPLLLAGAEKAGERWKDVAAESLKAGAERVDFSGGRTTHGVLSIIAAARLCEQLPYEDGALPLGQALHYAAAQPKWVKPPRWLEPGSGDDAEQLNLASAIAIT